MSSSSVLYGACIFEYVGCPYSYGKVLDTRFADNGTISLMHLPLPVTKSNHSLEVFSYTCICLLFGQREPPCQKSRSNRRAQTDKYGADGRYQMYLPAMRSIKITDVFLILGN